MDSENTLPPDWAIQRAMDVAKVHWSPEPLKAEYLRGDAGLLARSIIAHACLIAQHETPPVDPLLLRAREIWASEYESTYNRDNYFSAGIRTGNEDTAFAMNMLLRALREGIELGEAK